MFCVNCGSKLDEDALFCTNCGKKVAEEVSKEEIKFCMNCGSKLDEDSSFCSNCGKKVEYNEPIYTDTTTESSELETAKGISEVSTSVVENLSVVSAEKKSITVEETLDKNEQENSDIQDFIQESTKKEAETSKAVVERTQNENDKNHEMNENNVNLLSLKEYNCLSAEEKESYKSKLDSILEDEKTDADTKNTICKTLIQYGYIYYTKSKCFLENRSDITLGLENGIKDSNSKSSGENMFLVMFILLLIVIAAIPILSALGVIQ